jgi:threonine aldolase
VALKVPVAVLTSGFNTVMFCLSKGLCAPVGSMLVGNRKLIERARMVRKALGGGMRQAGVLAAAGLIALEEMPKRLAEDHANARLIAEHLADLPQIELDLATVQTNIVIFALKEDGKADELVLRLKRRGVLCGTVGHNSVRFVTHHDVDRAACEQAARVAIDEIAKL